LDRYNFDFALMRNNFIFELSRQTGECATRTRFVEIFHNPGGGSLSYNDDYFGVYSLMEKINRDDARVPVARLDRLDEQAPDVTGDAFSRRTASVSEKLDSPCLEWVDWFGWNPRRAR
jgi:hypothetical protein